MRKIRFSNIEIDPKYDAPDAPVGAHSPRPLNRQIRAVIADLRAHGQPPPPSAVRALRAGSVSESGFGTRLGILPVTPDGDAFAEYWRPIPCWPGYHASNFGRARWHALATAWRTLRPW